MQIAPTGVCSRRLRASSSKLAPNRGAVLARPSSARSAAAMPAFG